MYIGVDIGGTKTLVAVLDERGVITEKTKFPTAQEYDIFLKDLRAARGKLKIQDFMGGAAGIPTTNFDRAHGFAINFGNLPWQNVAIQADFEDIFKCPMVIENDAKLGGLSEAMLLKDRYAKVLYVTIGTGIGIALVVNGVIDTSIADGGGRTILLEHDGKTIPWEQFASGHAIVARFGKKAGDITDQDTWQTISRDLAKGFIHLIALMQPEVIIIGGGVGTYFDRYGDLLKSEIERYHIPLINMPELVGAQRPEEAVVYGCYDLVKYTFPNAKSH